MKFLLSGGCRISSALVDLGAPKKKKKKGAGGDCDGILTPSFQWFLKSAIADRIRLRIAYHTAQVNLYF